MARLPRRGSLLTISRSKISLAAVSRTAKWRVLAASRSLSVSAAARLAREAETRLSREARSDGFRGGSRAAVGFASSASWRRSLKGAPAAATPATPGFCVSRAGIAAGATAYLKDGCRAASRREASRTGRQSRCWARRAGMGSWRVKADARDCRKQRAVVAGLYECKWDDVQLSRSNNRSVALSKKVRQRSFIAFPS